MTSDLLELDAADLARVYDHELPAATVMVVADLLEELRTCEGPGSYYEFQRALFGHLWRTETVRANVRRNLKRIKKGKGLVDDPPALPSGTNPFLASSWELEDLVHVRAARQLRAVGDALAWRVSGFDRRYVMALAHNQLSGPMTNKAGIDYELGAVEEIWKKRGRFALLHDLTSCLRIADLTEFHADGYRGLHEVKKNGKRTSSQHMRMLAAIAAANHGAALPGTSVQLVDTDVPYANHLSILSDLMQIAESKGVAAAKVPGGRALIATDLLTVLRSDANVDTWVERATNRRASALRRAGIDGQGHHITSRSNESAGRSPLAPPFGIYPIQPDHAAALICDRAVYEVVLSAEILARGAVAAGFTTRVLLPDAHGEFGPSDEILEVRLDNATMTLHPGTLQHLMSELIEMDSFWGGVQAVMARALPVPSPTVVYSGEQNVWR